MIKYKVIKSGSKGNAVIIENLLIDCGVAYKLIEPYLPKIKYLFITHKHSDHLKKSTYSKIRKHYPRIKTMGNYSVNEVVEVDKIVSSIPIKLKGMVIQPFEVPHDVVCHGITFTKGNEKGIYVTDSAGTKEWIRDKYDLLLIESNHDETKLSMATKGGYDSFVSAKRHTSTQESKAFYYMNRKSKESEWVELHKSERFY